MLPAFVPDEVPRMPFGALVLTAVMLLGAPAEAQTGSGLTAVRARLLASNGELVVALGSNVDLYAGALTAAEVPELLSLALACAAMPARTQVTIYASLGGAPVKAKIERDKGGRLEAQLRGIPFADRARLFEIAETFLAKGAYNVRVEGPVAGRNIEARIRDRVPEATVIPTVALPPPSAATAAAGLSVDLFGRWRSTTVPGGTLVLRQAGGGVTWEYEAPTSAGLAFGRGTVRAEGTGVANTEALALSGRVTAGDEAPGGRPGQGSMSLTLRREGGTLRGTAVGSPNRTLPIEFVKDGIR